MTTEEENEFSFSLSKMWKFVVVLDDALQGDFSTLAVLAECLGPTEQRAPPDEFLPRPDLRCEAEMLDCGLFDDYLEKTLWHCLL